VGEFELIARYFKRAPRRAVLGVGDDCALLQATAGMQWAVSSDMLVEGRHFLSTADPRQLGHKALAVNLSDLAACGAQPTAFTLALALPQVQEAWLAAFAAGLLALADETGCELVGGDTTQGPLTISITVFGELPAGSGLLRSAAQAGDDLYVSGHLGDARLALEVFRGQIGLPAEVFRLARARMDSPTPRLALGQALRGVAHSAIDISDGLIGDLGHILHASGVGASIPLAPLPGLLACAALPGWAEAGVSEAQQLACVLAGGDDYELAFTAAPAQREAVALAAQRSQTPVTRIGCIDAQPGLRLLDVQGRALPPSNYRSFEHFY